jgi:hypothetical protein
MSREPDSDSPQFACCFTQVKSSVKSLAVAGLQALWDWERSIARFEIIYFPGKV